MASSSSPELNIAAGTYSEFTVMLLYKLKNGAITSDVNLVSIPSALTVTYNTNTQVTLGGCALTVAFSAGFDQEDWLPLGVTYN